MNRSAARRKPRGQMSESLLTIAFLTVSGGFQDAYTFLTRGRVFANAQTGNIVLMSERLFHGDVPGALRYLAPLTAFALGVWAAQALRDWLGPREGLHWRQWIILTEIAVLFAVGWLPQTLDPLANALVSFACAMQVQAFRKVNGHAFASTMCIGNLRSGVEAWQAYRRTQNPTARSAALHYLAVIACFALGAGLGSLGSEALGLGAIWLCCAGLTISFGLMLLPAQAADPRA